MNLLQSQLHSKFYWFLSNVPLSDCVVVFLICIGICTIRNISMKRPHRKPGAVFLYSVLVSGYTTFVVAVTLLGRQGGTVNTLQTVFSSYSTLLNGNYGILFDMAFNAILFIPIGILLALVFSPGYCFAISFAQSLLIETAQLLTGRGLFEVADLIHNTLGGIIGTLLLISMQKIFPLLRQSVARLSSHREEHCS